MGVALPDDFITNPYPVEKSEITKRSAVIMRSS